MAVCGVAIIARPQKTPCLQTFARAKVLLMVRVHDWHDILDKIEKEGLVSRAELVTSDIKKTAQLILTELDAAESGGKEVKGVVVSTVMFAGLNELGMAVETTQKLNIDIENKELNRLIEEFSGQATATYSLLLHGENKYLLVAKSSLADTGKAAFMIM